MKKRQYAGRRDRVGVMKLVVAKRHKLPGGAVGVDKRECRVFTPIALDKDGRKALRHLFTRLGMTWEVAEVTGYVPPGCVPSEDDRRRAFTTATAVVVRGSQDAFGELERHKYCRSLSFDVTNPLGFKRLALARAKTRKVRDCDIPDPREDASGFASRWQAACEWADALDGFDDDERDVLASLYCDADGDAGVAFGQFAELLAG